MIVCVLGMHKSGTTLIAETLHHSGIHMADVPTDLGYDESNKFERHQTQRINRRILAPVLVPTLKGYRLRKAGLDRAGYEKNLDSIAWVRRGRLRAVIEETPTWPVEELVQTVSAAHPDWGFKDPRTCLTYAWWQRALPPHRVVAVYRPFYEVLMRYKVHWRSPVRLMRVARSWIVHNALLARHLETCGDFVLLRYDEMMRDDAEFTRLRDYLGFDIDDRRRPELYRARGSGDTKRPGAWLPAPITRRAAAIEARLERIRRS